MKEVASQRMRKWDKLCLIWLWTVLCTSGNLSSIHATDIQHLPYLFTISLNLGNFFFIFKNVIDLPQQSVCS